MDNISSPLKCKSRSFEDRGWMSDAQPSSKKPMTPKYNALSQCASSTSCSDGLHPSSWAASEDINSTPADIDGSYATPISPVTYTPFSDDESSISHDSLPTTPEGGFGLGTTPAEGLTPLDSPRVRTTPNDLNAIDLDFAATPAGPFEFTAAPNEQSYDAPKRHGTPALLGTPILNARSPAGSPFTPGRTLACVHDAIHCLMEEADADDESLSDQTELEELMAPLGLGPAAIDKTATHDGDGDTTVLKTESNSPGIKDSLELSVPGLPWEMSGGQGEYDELVQELEAAFEEEVREQRRRDAEARLLSVHEDSEEAVEDEGYAADLED